MTHHIAATSHLRDEGTTIMCGGMSTTQGGGAAYSGLPMQYQMPGQTTQVASQYTLPTQAAPAQTAAMGSHAGHGHENSIIYQISAAPPNANQFIKGSLGADAGADFNLEKGKGFKDKAGRDPNGNDQKQNNLKKADANRPAYGIPKTVAGTNDKPNYVQDIQVSIGMGGLEALRPDVLKALIAQQDAGHGSVWNGVAYLTGLIDQHDGSVTPELEAMRSQIRATPVGGSGKTLEQWATNPKDENGTNWARSNHAMTGIKAYLQLEAAGIPSDVANKLANNDDMVSGAGRIDQIAPGRASNNQENTFTGQNAAERKEWARAADYAKQLNRPDILRILMDSHSMGSHMLTQYGNKGAESKINKNLGLDPNLDANTRKAQLVNYFLNNPKDPKKGDEPKKGIDATAQLGGPTAPQKIEQVEPPTKGGGDIAPPSSSGCPMMDAMAGAGSVGGVNGGGAVPGGGPDTGSIQAVLTQLIATLNQLVQSISANANGGGPLMKPVTQTTFQTPPVVQAGTKLTAAQEALPHTHA
ncbi:MAG: hypothetical protein JWM98_1906 [Thermoleophilia bacterium]|nr:hypothetical protein [Thermoleophilia bacterium]